MPEPRTYKFLVVPVVQLVDEEDLVVGEAQPDQPDTVFGLDGLHRYAEEFEARLAAPQNGGSAVQAAL